MGYLIAPKGFEREINYRPPVNMRPEWEHLFRPDHAYRKVKLGARLLRNVFVNHYGLVINNGLLVPGCAPNIGFGSYDDGFYFPHWKKAMEQMLVSRFGKSIESRHLDDDRTYLVIHSPWFSYYFWLTECLPRLLMVREHLHELVLIYPEQWDRFPFVTETLALFPELQVERVKQDVHLRVSKLVMPEVKPWTPMFMPDQIFQVRKLLFQAIDDQGMPSSPTDVSKNVYISRKSAARRRFTNENGVEEMLADQGFEATRMEELDFFSQVRLMRDTRLLAGITGAGHINIMFMQQHGGFLDLTNKDYVTKSQYKFHYFKLCNLLEINYAVSFFEHENAPDADHYSNQNLIADFGQLHKDLQILNSYVG
jgi:capsular polysaccharide biosynthesis protein